MGVAGNLWPNGARVYTWNGFLAECDACAASLPEVENWGVKNANSKGGDVKGIASGNLAKEKSGAFVPRGACFRCGLSGHAFSKCPSTKCSICHLQIGVKDPNMTIQTLDHDVRGHSSGGAGGESGGGSKAASKLKEKTKEKSRKPSYSTTSTDKLTALVSEIQVELKKRKADDSDDSDSKSSKKSKKKKAREAKAAAAISAIADPKAGAATG
jgi:hypothetical protein